MLDDPFIIRWLSTGCLIIDGLFGSDEGFREHGKETHAAVHEEIRQIVPKERLLEYRIADGWDPLCKFLGHDVPKISFPKVNESAEFKDRNAVMGKRAMLRIAKRSLPILAALGAVGGAYLLRKL